MSHYLCVVVSSLFRSSRGMADPVIGGTIRIRSSSDPIALGGAQ